MRNKGRIIALLAVVAVLVVVWIVFGKQLGADPAAQATPIPEDPVNAVTLVPFSQSDMIKMVMETPEGTLTMNRKESTQERRTQLEDGTVETTTAAVTLWESKDMDVDTDNANAVAFGGGFMKTMRMIVEDATAEDLKNFGFENKWQLTFHTKDASASVVIGDETPDKNAYYVMDAGKNTIYTAGKYTVEPLKMDRLLLLNKNLYHRADTLPQDITSIKFVRNGEMVFVAAINSDGFWDMSEPIAVEADGTAFNTMQAAFAGLTATAHVEQNPGDWAKYGLEKPAYEFTYLLAGKEHVLQIGNKDPENSYLYCRLDNGNTVFTQNPEKFIFLDKPFVELIDKFIYIPAIYDVTKVVVHIDGRVDTMELDVPKPNQDKDAEELPETYILNGKKLEGKDSISGLKRYYQGAIGVRADKVDFDAKPVYEPEKSVLTIEYTMRNRKDTFMKVELIPTEDGYGYYGMRNGEYSGLIVSKTQMDEESMGIRQGYNEMNEKIAEDAEKAKEAK